MWQTIRANMFWYSLIALIWFVILVVSLRNGSPPSVETLTMFSSITSITLLGTVFSESNPPPRYIKLLIITFAISSVTTCTVMNGSVFQSPCKEYKGTSEYQYCLDNLYDDGPNSVR